MLLVCKAHTLSCSLPLHILLLLPLLFGGSTAVAALLSIQPRAHAQPHASEAMSTDRTSSEIIVTHTHAQIEEAK